MGCGSSAQVVPSSEEKANGHAKMANGNSSQNGHHHEDDGIPTVTLPETPPAKPKPKPPISFEIPLEEFDSKPRNNTPPPHLQRLLDPKQPEVSLPDIEEKLAEAEIRRLALLQQRAASAHRRTQKMMRSFGEMDRLDSDHESMETIKPGANMAAPTERDKDTEKNIT